jgi:hypothetical protein
VPASGEPEAGQVDTPHGSVSGPVVHAYFWSGGIMQIATQQGRIDVHVGATFGVREVARLQEAVTALGPFSEVDIDFGSVRECDEAALAELCATLLALQRGEVKFHGLTLEQWRLLTLVGVAHGGA